MSHTTACRLARVGHHHQAGPNDETPDWPRMSMLTVADQQAVLDCADPSHDAVRLFLRGTPWKAPWKEVR